MKIKVYKNQFGYTTLAKNKEDKMYIQVQFKKGIEPNFEQGQIKIKDAFLSMYKNKNGYAIPKLVIMDYEEVTNSESNNEDTIQQDDLPF